MKLVYELVVEGVNAATELQKQRDLVKQLNKEYKASTAPDEQKRLVGELAKAKVAINDLTKAQKDLNREFKATQVPTDSIAGMRLELAKLTDEINNLSKAERESDFGKNLIANQQALYKEVTKNEQALGNFSRNVGNYKDALKGAADDLTGGLATGGIAAGLGAVIAIMKVGIDVALEYEAALDDLSALTGLEGADLKNLENVADGLKTINVNGVEVVSTGTEILNALKLVGGARPELLENAEALGEVTKQAIILSKASGDTLEGSVEALTTVLGQFNLEAADSGRVINELAAGAKVGSSEIPQTTEALQKFGAVAKITNVTTGESIALIELLADRQLKGAEAGTQLRSILAKLAGADVLPKEAQKAFERLGIDINVLKDATLPLEVRLRELGKAQGDVSALTKIFGLENLQAATIITGGLDKYDQLKTGIEGTNEAFKQASIRADNATTSFQNLKNKGLNELQETFTLLTPVLGTAANGIGALFDNVDLGAESIKAVVGNLGPFVDILKLIGTQSKVVRKETATAAESIDAVFGNLRAADPLAESIAKRYAETQKNAAALAKELEDLGVGGEKANKKIKETAEPAAGSIEALRKRVSTLKVEMEGAKPDQIPRILGNLTKAEGELKILEDQVERLRNTAIGQDSKLTDPLSSLPSPELAGQVQSEINDARLKEIQKFGEQVAKDDAKLKDERIKAAIKEEEEKERGKQLIKDAAFEAGQQAISAAADTLTQKAEDEKNAKLTALDEQYEKDKELAAGNAAQLAKIDKDYQKKKDAIEKEAARERQKIAVTESIINGLLSVARVLYNPAQAIATGIAAAINTAIIATKKFAVGGFTGKGSRRDDTGERVVNAQLHEGEYVAPRSQVEQFPHLFKMLDMRRTKRGASTGIGYAVGGFNTAPATSFASAQAQTAQAISLTAEATINEQSAQLIADLVAQAVYQATAAGFNDADRTNERKQALEDFTNV